ncbi:tail fiber protein [Coleofasciculus sp. FACHB-129]|uniref:tail fiber protein n=1 Tax=Cyanophyceae TaxID=3028117 RepID=UPI0018EF47D3
MKAAVDYADTKAKKNGDSNENFTAAQLTATQLTINNKAVKAIKDEILENDQENETSLPTIAAVISYLDTAVKHSVDTESQSAVVRGMIMMWSGQANQIPNGWALCDGQNGTPDLADRFIVGAGQKYAVGSTGGAEQVTLSERQIPAHSHEYDRVPKGRMEWKIGREDDFWAGQYKPEWETARSVSVGGNESHENMPPYYALAFIMKL